MAGPRRGNPISGPAREAKQPQENPEGVQTGVRGDLLAPAGHVEHAWEQEVKGELELVKHAAGDLSSGQSPLGVIFLHLRPVHHPLAGRQGHSAQKTYVPSCSSRPLPGMRCGSRRVTVSRRGYRRVGLLRAETLKRHSHEERLAGLGLVCHQRRLGTSTVTSRLDPHFRGACDDDEELGQKPGDALKTGLHIDTAMLLQSSGSSVETPFYCSAAAGRLKMRRMTAPRYVASVPDPAFHGCKGIRAPSPTETIELPVLGTEPAQKVGIRLFSPGNVEHSHRSWLSNVNMHGSNTCTWQAKLFRAVQRRYGAQLVVDVLVSITAQTERADVVAVMSDAKLN
ncbi:uncharacterized protein BO72DRAFT_497579 [Aspergillus fijiensis CBS 313.89]|uniref:Uncharacterized protein n=1 Tax=Aspergillus fijiensis CBS 313.89 TaxID=1448319 RepID=A0A8G1RPB7_9EURO|nr:uncharacterized protein BO72DRAFT_497579 [Aspergillus fijiensis CBS 313.89]RAK75848.1 hypothetical protein BO72DRAFT_497579 [Aspergillus fijiensis CBS 313.89]